MDFTEARLRELQGELVLASHGGGFTKGRLIRWDREAATLQGDKDSVDRTMPPDYLGPTELYDSVHPLPPGEQKRIRFDEMDADLQSMP
jgi:hypothetical protein